MPPLKSSLIKPSKSMLFFHIWNANFSVTPINSQMYMTKPKQVQKKFSENTGKTFSVIMPSFTCRVWAYLRKLLYSPQTFVWLRSQVVLGKLITFFSHNVWPHILQRTTWLIPQCRKLFSLGSMVVLSTHWRRLWKMPKATKKRVTSPFLILKMLLEVSHILW